MLIRFNAQHLILNYTRGLLLFLFFTDIDTQTQLSVKLLSRPADQVPLCALDTPSRTVTPQTMPALPRLQGGLPAMVLCAYECTSAGDCRQFNTVEDPESATSCQLYNYLPVNFQPQTNCLHYMTPDIDECVMNADACDSNASCTNTIGSYVCTCNAGYTGNGIHCSDVDECAVNNDTCDPNASCTNTIGSYVCTCNAGYTGSGIYCSDVDECLNTNICRVVPNAVCKNTDGNYLCECSPRHFGNGTYCTDTFELYTKSGDAVNLLVTSGTSSKLRHSSNTAAAKFKLVPCLCLTCVSASLQPSCVSMTPVSNPGWYVRHSSFWLYAETGSGSPFYPDASFILEKNTFNADHSAFHSIYSSSNYYISSVSGSSQLMVVKSGGASGNEDLASFTVVVV